MKSVVVTGGSGKAGRATIRELLDHGYQVMNVDVVPPAEALCHFMKTDLNDLGQTIDALRLATGTIDRRRASLGEPTCVIHLAGIPAPGLAPDATIFQNNMMTTYNVFCAATWIGLSRVVWASSETTYGLPFTRTPLSASSHRHSAIFCRSNRSRPIDTSSRSAQTPPRLTWICGTGLAHRRWRDRSAPPRGRHPGSSSGAGTPHRLARWPASGGAG